MSAAIRLRDALDVVYNMDVSDCKNAEEAGGKIYQAIGDLPEGIDGRTGFALFDLAQHYFADTGKFRQFPQAQVSLCTQAF